MDPEAALAELAALRDEISHAADAILTATEAALALLQQPGSDDEVLIDKLNTKLYEILEACSFEDLAGQRISKLSAFIQNPAAVQVDNLLNGPALKGAGLEQDAADAVFSTAPRPG